jgi:sugar-specific transcriptional regulator TrmB
LTQEWMLKTLVNLGFGQRDAEVYVFLALNGAHKASDIAEAIKTYERQVYRTLRKLQNQKIVSGTQDLPAHFTALPFDKLLDLLIKANLQEARRIEQNKDDILALWDSCVKKEPVK